MTNADRIRAMTDEKLALIAHNLEAQSIAIGQASIDAKALSVEEWLNLLEQEVSDNG